MSCAMGEKKTWPPPSTEMNCHVELLPRETKLKMYALSFQPSRGWEVGGGNLHHAILHGCDDGTLPLLGRVSLLSRMHFVSETSLSGFVLSRDVTSGLVSCAEGFCCENVGRQLWCSGVGFVVMNFSGVFFF